MSYFKCKKAKAAAHVMDITQKPKELNYNANALEQQQRSTELLLISLTRDHEQKCTRRAMSTSYGLVPYLTLREPSLNET